MQDIKVDYTFYSGEVLSNGGFYAIVLAHIVGIICNGVHTEFFSNKKRTFVMKSLTYDGEFILTKNLLTSNNTVECSKSGVI